MTDEDSGGRDPDVSVVLISYNDAGRLPRAIRSLQRQTLRALEIVVVDDASTDDTAAVVARIAATDPRIRYERLDRNSGGCSAPRNAGLDLATAPWVMFCDSDDEYERHACKNLLEAAERTGADVVCGTAERLDTRTGRTRRWRPEVHEREQVAEGIAELPELLYDTISVNKIYRRALLQDAGIRFPEGLLFEDQLFTLEAMAAAARVAVIPQLVYRWYVDRLSEEPSITQRRNEVRNVESRVEINRRIDAFLQVRGLDRVQRVKDLKFLRHDLYLYLASILEVDDDTAAALVDRLVPYVEQVNLEPVWELRPALRVAVFHLLVRDVDGIRAAMRFVKWASVVDVPIVADGDRQLWGCSHLADDATVAGIPSRRWLDVTDLGLLSIPFSQRRFLHRIESISADDSTVIARGSTVDYDGSLEAADGVELRYLIAGERTAVTVPARWTGREDGRRTWLAEGRAESQLARALRERDRGTLGVAVRRGPLENVTGVRSAESAVTPVALTFPGPARATGPDTMVLTAHENGAVGWRAERRVPWRSRLAAAQGVWFRIPGTRRLAIAWRLVERDWLPALAGAVAAFLPRRRLVVLEAGGGRTFAGGVRAVGQALAESGLEPVWVFRTEPALVPAGARGVLRGSIGHAWSQARASVIVDDGSATAFAPRARCVAVNAAGEVPVHRLGLDDPSVLVSRAAVASVKRQARQWRLLVTPSTAAAAVLVGAYGYRGAVADAGLVRMDSVAAGGDGDDLTALRGSLDLPTDRPVVLHLPAPGDERGELIDLERWAGALGDRVYLVVRSDAPVPTRLRSSIRQLLSDEPLPGMIAAADLVISDYSSLIGDAALVDRPIVLFQPDRERYVNRTRGLYPGVDRVGPVVEHLDGLIAEVSGWLADPAAWQARYGPDRRAWAADWCGPRDGRSSLRARDAVLAQLESR